ncbi:MAG: sel1 repeat family protein [Emcibacter sp.]|nr:sel1 repeat family protein [Emcibacter sp.]
MNNILIRNIIIGGVAMLMAFPPYFATTAYSSETFTGAKPLVKEGKDDGVKSMLFIAAQNGDMKAQDLFIQRNTQPKIQAQKPIVDQAKTWAEGGNVALMVWLGDNYYTGNQLPKRFENAITWYSKAAKKGDVSAQFNLGYMYFDGQGVKRNLIRARQLFTMAANKNHAPSIRLLKRVNAKISALEAEWEKIKEEQRQAQMEVDKLEEQLRQNALAAEKNKQAVKSTKKSTKKLSLAELVNKEMKLCFSGKSKSCFDLAVANEAGKITGKVEYEIAEKFYIKACDLNSYRACMNLANNYASKKFKSLSKNGVDDGFKKHLVFIKRLAREILRPHVVFMGHLMPALLMAKKKLLGHMAKHATLALGRVAWKLGKYTMWVKGILTVKMAVSHKTSGGPRNILQ